MLSNFWRLRMQWIADQTLTYDNGARIAIRLTPWKLVAGVWTPDTVITEDLGFGAGETIVTTGEVEGSVIDNTSNTYYGMDGFFSIIADADSTDGTAYLFLEKSDADGSNWPSDMTNFKIDEDMRLISTLNLATVAVDQSRGTNFEF